MNKKSLFSTVGLIAIALGLIASVAIISVLPGWRVDLTEDDLYTLSEGTGNIVSNLSEPLELMFFYSDSATEDAPQIRSYATRVQELLEEMVIASDGNLSLTMIDPEPFSEDEDLATQYGIQAVPVSQGAPGIYFGLVVRPQQQSDNPLEAAVYESMPLIRPDQEQFLEYEFMKLITKVEDPELSVIGLITGLDIDGGFDPTSGQATPPWLIMDTIRQLYEVRRLPVDVETIEEDVDILMLIHPNNLSEQTLYAVDQHVMRGGEIVVFLDPNAESRISRTNQGNLVPAGMSSDMPRLLESWGVSYDSSKILADSELALRVRMGQNQRPMPHLGMQGIQRNNLAQDDIITNRLETINIATSGVLAPAEGASTSFEPLMQSSSNSMLMDRALLEDVMDPSVLFDEFSATPESYVMAARVSGVIDSAFPDGRPVQEEEVSQSAEETSEETSEETAEEAAEETADEVADNSANPAQPLETADADSSSADEAAAEEEPLPAHIPQSQGMVNILLFADTDLLTDRLWVQVAQFLGQRIPQPFANNGDLIINSLDNLSGGADLVSIRSRGRYSRPFTRVLELQREADDRLRVEEAELLDRMAETEQALAELNSDEEGNPIGQVTPEIQAEIDRFNAELVDTRRRLRDVQYQLTEDIERLGSNLKAINTALIPALLTILMLVAHFSRTRRRGRA
ncbi:MAG: Gldg family protein [Pseudomonadales bacterium]|nr:Gldg family protein [Pseudomonadales bacterium]